MRLKELTVQGYKSFATKTRFEFPPGVTAIVGPNGSGKSNIADAIRWALGEQRTSQLRARKTDDMIFAGTEKRARSGLAEVSLLLDNTDGWLPVEFAEVEVTRRAHRDGTSEYAVNGATVRLKELTDLLGGRLGQSTYTVIGQGLVDSALTLRPDERRGLIDEAAGIVPLQRRRDAALRRLEETGVNLTRVKDILAELTPRLKRMERLAERAEKHDELASALVGDLQRWYGYHLRKAADDVDLSQREVERLMALSTEAQSAVERIELAFRERDLELEARSTRLSERRAERDRLAAEAAAAHEAESVARARLEGVAAALLEGSARDDEESSHGMNAHLVAVIEATETLRSSAVEAEVEWAAAREQLALAEAERQALTAAWESAHRAAVEASAQDEEARARHIELKRTGTLLAAEAQTNASAATERAGAAANTHQAAEAAQLGATEALAAARVAAEALTHAESVRDDAVELLRRAREAHAEASARVGALAARHRSLSAQIAASGGSEAPWRSGQAAHSYGRLGEVLDVDPGWEAAAAVALGNLLGGVLVADDRQLMAALADIAPAFEGQVTLIPNDAATEPSWTPKAGELRAVDVVRSTQARGAVVRLLANVAFVPTAEDALASVRRAGGPAAAASRDGRMFLSTGVVVAGAPARDLIALERERRAVPDLLAAAEADEQARGQDVDAADAALRSATEMAAQCLAARTVADAAAREAGAAAATARTAAEREATEVTRAEEMAARLVSEESAARARAEELAAEMARLAEVAVAARTAEAEARVSLEAHDLTEVRSRSEQAWERARVAGANEAAKTAEMAAIQAQIASIAAAGAARRERAGALAQERANLEQEVERLHADSVAVSAELEAVAAALAPDEESLRADRRQSRDEAAGLDLRRAEAATAAGVLVEARLAAARAETQRDRLLEHLAADAEYLPASLVAAGADRSLPPVESLPDGLDTRIHRVRGQLRDLGAIDAEALAAFRETAEHHTFLTEQRTDLLAAEDEVRGALGELETEMAARFDRTFEAVAREFEASFPELFGGGEARLELDPESGGIEILARPPGKRAQPLALLSGGERSLTAVALVFALLRASETPFVVLDEVDAALDEANVDRFRSALERLAQHTQVVIVTHNRGTVQTAGTVYGVSMGDDGASQTLSVRVDTAVPSRP